MNENTANESKIMENERSNGTYLGIHESHHLPNVEEDDDRFL